MPDNIEIQADRPLSSVVGLGAICEIEDLTAAPRELTLDGWGYVFHSVPSKIAFFRHLRKWYKFLMHKDFYTTAPRKLMLEQRQKAIKSGQTYFYLEEFADLDGGRRVILRDDRGWSFWPETPPNSQWKTVTGRELVKEAILILEPDDDEDWIVWIIERLHFLGIEVDSASVHAAPFQVEFGPRVQSELCRLASA